MMHGKGIEDWFQSLAELAGADEAVFLVKRQLLLSEFLARQGVRSDKLAALQVSIDQMRVLSDSPSDTLVELLELLAENAGTLQTMIEDLSRELDAAEPES